MNEVNIIPRRAVGKSLDIVKAPKQKPVTPNNVMDHERERDRNDFFEAQTTHERSDPLMFYLIIGLCAIVLLVVLSVILIYRSTKNPSASTQASDTASQAQPSTNDTQKTDTTTTEAPAKAADQAATPAPTEAAKPAAVDKASVKIRIVNGNGRNGEASLMAKALKDDGFAQITTGNAASRYKSTVIYYKTGKLPEAQAVEAIIKTKYQTSLLEDSNITKDNDILIALGNV